MGRPKAEELVREWTVQVTERMGPHRYFGATLWPL